MKLIGAITSPYVRKVRIVMAEKKLDYQLLHEEVWSTQTQISEFNPLGKVPCLIMEGGEALFDSRVIVEYLDTLSPVGKLIPSSGRERAEVKTWEALSDGVLDANIASLQDMRTALAENRDAVTAAKAQLESLANDLSLQKKSVDASKSARKPGLIDKWEKSRQVLLPWRKA